MKTADEDKMFLLWQETRGRAKMLTCSSQAKRPEVERTGKSYSLRLKIIRA